MSCESDEWTQLSEISLATRLARAEKTLAYAGYTYCGGELWKPPLGPSAKPLLERIDSLEQERDKLAAQLHAALGKAYEDGWWAGWFHGTNKRTDAELIAPVDKYNYLAEYDKAVNDVDAA